MISENKYILKVFRKINQKIIFFEYYSNTYEIQEKIYDILFVLITFVL